jgi:hypothetical protein
MYMYCSNFGSHLTEKKEINYESINIQRQKSVYVCVYIDRD